LMETQNAEEVEAIVTEFILSLTKE